MLLLRSWRNVKTMKLFLKNSTYKSEDYLCNVWINDREAQVYALNGKDELVIDIPQGSDVKIEIQNTFLKSNKKIFLMFFYWFLGYACFFINFSNNIGCIISGISRKILRYKGDVFSAVCGLRNWLDDIYIEYFKKMKLYNHHPAKNAGCVLLVCRAWH